MGRTVTNVNRTCGPTHLLVFSGNKIFLNLKLKIHNIKIKIILFVINFSLDKTIRYR